MRTRRHSRYLIVRSRGRCWAETFHGNRCLTASGDTWDEAEDNLDALLASKGLLEEGDS